MTQKNNTNNLTETILYNMESTARIAKARAHRLFEEDYEFGITFNEYVILDNLYTHPKIHQRDLAKLLFKGTANLSRDLDKLEQRGLIKRDIDIRAKRIVKTLVLTPDGENICQKASKKAMEDISEIESIFTKNEQQTFISLISKLRNRLVQEDKMFFE